MIYLKLSIPTDKLIGEKLAVPIYNANGMLLVNSGQILSEKLINHISSIGINTVYIHDGNDDITLSEILPSNIRLKFIKLLKNEFIMCKKINYLNETVISKIVEDLLREINLSENAFLYNNIGSNDDLELLSNHSINTTLVSIMIGVKRNYATKKLFNLGIAALLHDIGKLYSLKEDHVELGYRLLKKNLFFTSTMTIAVLQHHENINGTGYPSKISSEKIFEFSKIISLSNEYINHLFSKETILPNEIIEKLSAETLTKFDANIFKDFSRSIYCYPNGLTVKLNNQLTGLVIMQNRDMPLRPVIMVKINDQREYIDLTKNLTLFINKIKI